MMRRKVGGRMSVADRANSIHVLLCFWATSCFGPIGYWMVKAMVLMASSGGGAGGASAGGGAPGVQSHFAVFAWLVGLAVAGGYSVLASMGYYAGGWLVPRIDADHTGRLCFWVIGTAAVCFVMWRLCDPMLWLGGTQMPQGRVLLMTAAAVAIPLVLGPALVYAGVCMRVLRAVDG